jgi:hypothetical protein
MLSSELTTAAAGRFIAQDGSKLGEIVDTSSVTGWDVVVGSVLIVISFPLSKAIAWVVGKALRKVRMPEELRPLIRRLTRAAVIIVMFAVAMSLGGVSVAWFTVVLAAVLLVAVLMLRPFVEELFGRPPVGGSQPVRGRRRDRDERARGIGRGRQWPNHRAAHP